MQAAATSSGTMTWAQLTIVRTSKRFCAQRLLLSIALAGLLEFPLCLAGQEQIRTGPPPVSFTNEIPPIFLQKCQTCHGPEKSKGGYRLHTFELLMKGGESKEPAITPGFPEKSKLFALITAKDEDDRMPQKDDPLPATQIALIGRWIQQGAKFDG